MSKQNAENRAHLCPHSLTGRSNYTGKCVPASIGFAETEDDEMCLLLGLYAFTNDDPVPSPIDPPDRRRALGVCACVIRETSFRS